MVVVCWWCHCHCPGVQQVNNCPFLEWAGWQMAARIVPGDRKSEDSLLTLRVRRERERTGLRQEWRLAFARGPRTCFQPSPSACCSCHAHPMSPAPTPGDLEKPSTFFYCSSVLLWPNILDYFQISSKHNFSSLHSYSVAQEKWWVFILGLGFSLDFLFIVCLMVRFVFK